MDYPISFDDYTCPLCGKGKICKKILTYKQINTCDGYECNACGQSFATEYVRLGDTYVCKPLYSPSRIKTFKTLFTKEGM